MHADRGLALRGPPLASAWPACWPPPVCDRAPPGPPLPAAAMDLELELPPPLCGDDGSIGDSEVELPSDVDSDATLTMGSAAPSKQACAFN